jgi:hypothetical protein
LELWREGGWRLKVYGISYDRGAPRLELVAAAKEVARERLPSMADGAHYGVGYLGVHDARKACFAFVGWWAERYELHHHLFRAPRDRAHALEPAPPGLVGCVWDLYLVAFERQAWMSALLGQSEPDPEGYLAMRLNADV